MPVRRTPRDLGDVIVDVERRLQRLELRGRGFSLDSVVAGVKTIPSPTRPEGTDHTVGDLWFDTDDGNRVYRWDGEDWVPVLGTLPERVRDEAAAALVASQDSAATVDNLVTTYVQAGAPASAAEGDLWIDTDDNSLHRWSGAGWAALGDTGVGELVTKEQNRVSWADGRITTRWQFNEPVPTGFGDLWVDTDGGNQLYRWNNFDWVKVLDWSLVQFEEELLGKVSTYRQASVPVSRAVGDIWINTADGNRQYRADSVGADAIAPGEWVEVQDAAIGDAKEAADEAKDAADEAKDAADGAIEFARTKNTVYRQDEPPVATPAVPPSEEDPDGTPAVELAVGDAWIDTNDGNHLRIWDGEDWVSAKDIDITLSAEAAAAAREAADQAIADAEEAMNFARSRTKVYRQDEMPTGGTYAAGDVWFDTNDGNRIYVHNGSTFVDARDAGIAAAAQAAAAAQQAAADAAGDASDAMDFAETRNKVYYQTEKPTGGTYQKGDTWFDTNDGNRIYVHNGADFVDARDATIGAAQAAADAKSTVHAQDAPPAGLTAADSGDIWIDTNDGNATYRYLHGSTAGTNGAGGAGPWISTLNTSPEMQGYVDTRVAQSASGGNKVTYSTAAPGSTANSAGDIWFQRDASNFIVAQFIGAGGTSWTPTALSHQVISSLDLGKATVGELSGQYIKGDAIDGKTVTGATFQTTATANRGVRLSSSGMTAHDGTGLPTFVLDAATGGVTLNGAVAAGGSLTGAAVTGGVVQTTDQAARGVKMNSTGLTAYDGSGNPTFTLTAATGAIAMTGPIMTGGSVTGATLQTTDQAARGVKINAAGLNAYDGAGDLRFSLNAATGGITLKGGVVTDGSVTGATVTGGVVQTSDQASRGIKLSSAGMSVYDNAGATTLTIDSAGNVSMKGKLTTGSDVSGATVTGGLIQTQLETNRGVKINSNGIVAYNTSGAQVFTVNPNTGYAYFEGSFYASGTIYSGSIYGTTITTDGATGVIQTTSSANRGVKINSAGLTGWDSGGNETFRIDASTGSVSLTGTIKSGSLISGATIEGGTLRTAPVGSTRVELSGLSARFYATNTEVGEISPVIGGLAIFGPGSAWITVGANGFYMNGANIDMNYNPINQVGGLGMQGSITMNGNSMNTVGTITMNSSSSALNMAGGNINNAVLNSTTSINNGGGDITVNGHLKPNQISAANPATSTQAANARWTNSTTANHGGELRWTDLSSSITVKDHVEDLGEHVEPWQVYELEPVSYRYSDREVIDRPRDYRLWGFIAENMRDLGLNTLLVFPEDDWETMDRPQEVDYAKVCVVQQVAIRDLNARLVDAEERLAAAGI